MKNNRRSKIRLGQIVLTGFLTSWGVFANAGDFVLKDNKLTIVGSGASAGFSQSATVSSSGVVTNIANVPTSSGVGIPSFNFEIIQTNVAVNTTYAFNVGVILDDDNNNSRLETRIGTLNLAVDGSGNITGNIPAQNLRLLGRTSGGTVQVQADIPNASINGPISITGGTVSFNGANLISRIRESNSLFKDVILPEFDRNASYTYTIVIKQTNAPAQQFGVDTDASAAYAFSAFPAMAVDTFMLNNKELDAGFASAQRVTGTFNVLLNSGSSGGGTSTTTVSGASTATTTATSNFDSAIAGGAPSAAVINEVVTASQTLNTVLASTNPTTVSTTDLSNLGASVKVLVQTNVKNTGLTTPSTAITSNTNAVLASAATLLKGFSEKETIEPADAKAALDIVKDLLTNAPGFFAGGNADDKNLTSMSDLLAATFKLGAKTVPPVEFKAQDYSGAVAALDALAQKQQQQGSPDQGDPLISTFNSITITSTGNFPGETVNFTLTSNANTALLGPSLAPAQSSNLLIQAALAPMEVVNDAATGTIRVTIGGNVYIGRITEQSLLPSTIADGTILLRNGNILLAQAGIGYTIISSPANAVDFKTAVTNAGFDLAYRLDGGFDLKSGPTQNFTGVFAYDNVAGKTGACGTISIASPTGAVNSPNYAFTATCATSGMVRKIVPYISQSAFYNLGTTFKLKITTNVDTGVISIGGLGNFKPSFFRNALSLNDQALLTNNATNGFAFRASDVNGDGKVDYEVIHSSGVQILYGM